MMFLVYIKTLRNHQRPNSNATFKYHTQNTDPLLESSKWS